MTRSSPRRALTALLLAMTLVTLGCTAVRLKEHRHPGPAVSVKVVWDDHDVSRLVGGVNVRLEPFGGEPLEGVTRADAPLLFDWLQPGLHRVVLMADGMQPLEQTFDLPPRRRMSVRVLVDALEPTTHDEDAADQDAPPRSTPFVLQAAGKVASVTVDLITGWGLERDDEPGEWRSACEVCTPHRRDDPLCSCSCHG